MARVLAHAICGGWDLRHECCAEPEDNECAEIVEDGSQAAIDIANGERCGGCGGDLREPAP